MLYGGEKRYGKIADEGSDKVERQSE